MRKRSQSTFLKLKNKWKSKAITKVIKNVTIENIAKKTALLD